MKKLITLLLLLFLIISGLYAQLTVNGLLDSTVSGTVSNGSFSFGIEEYANIRFQARLRDNKAVVYGAVNLIAAAGTSGADLKGRYDTEIINYLDHDKKPQQINVLTGYAPSAFVAGENYIAGIELERLYFRLNFEKANFDGGLFRLPFGYSTVWGSSDFLNPKNPLKPDARLRGVLGAAAGIFPAGDLKIGVFAAAPRNPFLSGGRSVLAGLSAENHWSKASVQALYSYETPNDSLGSKYGIHRAGLSVKADVEVTLILDALYTYNHQAGTKWDGLSLSAGADYSFLDGKLIIMAEYLYNGKNSSTALSSNNPLGMSDRHYLYSGLTWLFNDFTNINASLISCLNKINFTPIITFNHDLFQGASLAIVLMSPGLNSNTFTGGKFGFNGSAKLRLRF